VPSPSSERQIDSRLQDHGVRYTKGRRAVVAALDAADGPRAASELFADLDGAIPLSSLYRSLAVLEDAGVVAPHHGAKGITRYELAEWLAGHHHHVVCVECGAVDDIRLAESAEHDLESLVAAVAATARFHPTGHSLEIDGTCEKCA
jgi:Fur family ferric uptake transcriptional regulator